MVTMVDVARLAGVSTATVSHVLNDTRTVSGTTRAAVLAAVQQVGYIPNTVARSLATSRTSMVGIVLSALSNPYFGDMLPAAERAATAAGYTLVLADPHEDAARERIAVERLHHHRVDGVVMASTGEPSAALEYLARHRVPTVLLDRVVDSGRAATLDRVGSENRASTATLTEHLVAHGHRRIALVAGLDGLATTEERRQGYREAMAAAGLGSWEVCGASAIEPARRATISLLGRPDPPTAVVAGNAAMAIGVVSAARDAGVRVPDDLALATFDDVAFADAFSPRLTAMAQPFGTIAREAMRLLVRRLAEPDAEPEVLRLAPTLVVRESCGCRPHGPDATGNPNRGPDR